MLVWERAQAFLPLPYMNTRVITERSTDGGPQIGNSGCTRVLDLPVYGNLAKQMRHFAPASRCEMPFGQGALPRDGGSVMRQMVVVSLAKAVDLNWPGDRGSANRRRYLTRRRFGSRPYLPSPIRFNLHTIPKRASAVDPTNRRMDRFETVPSRSSGRQAIGLGRFMYARTALIGALLAVLPAGLRADDQVEQHFRERIQPILEDHCFACHGNGMKKGGLALDEFTLDQARMRDGELWWAVLKNIRAGIMPPLGRPRLTETERLLLEDWIKYGAFRIERTISDPGQITLRRLNRVEYRNTIRDLMGVDYDTNVKFPPDDSGHGFDNIADVLTLSPMLLEKYLAAAKSVVAKRCQWSRKSSRRRRSPVIALVVHAQATTKRSATAHCRFPITSWRRSPVRSTLSTPGSTKCCWT